MTRQHHPKEARERAAPPTRWEGGSSTTQKKDKRKTAPLPKKEVGESSATPKEEGGESTSTQKGREKAPPREQTHGFCTSCVVLFPLTPFCDDAVLPCLGDGAFPTSPPPFQGAAFPHSSFFWAWRFPPLSLGGGGAFSFSPNCCPLTPGWCCSHLPSPLSVLWVIKGGDGATQGGEEGSTIQGERAKVEGDNSTTRMERETAAPPQKAERVLM